MPFDLDAYEPVEKRLAKYWEKHLVAGRITTELLSSEAERMAGRWIVKASVYRGDELRDQPPAATGLAMEVETERGVNSTSALENCETSAIGRALANFNYAAKGKRPSREEMSKTATGAGASLTDGRTSAAPAPVPPTSGDTQDEAPETSVGAEVLGKPSAPADDTHHFKPVTHVATWEQSPTLTKFEVCTFDGCLETRRKKAA